MLNLIKAAKDNYQTNQLYELKDKVSIITGSSKGTGTGIVKEYATERARVMVNHSSGKESADRIVEEKTQNGGSVVVVQADIFKIADNPAFSHRYFFY